MKIRYFEKRGEVWLDFRDAEGKRHRVPSGCKSQPQAELAAPSIVALRLPSVPTKSTSPASTSLTLRQAFDKGLKEREIQRACKSDVVSEDSCLLVFGPKHAGKHACCIPYPTIEACQNTAARPKP